MSLKKSSKNITLKETMKSKNEKNNIIRESCSTQNLIYYISLIIGIILNIIIIKALDEINNNTTCKCDKIKNKGKYLKEWFIFLIIYELCIFFIFLISGECFEIINKYNMLIILGTIVSIINIIMLIRLYLYINSIRKECSCSYGKTQKFIYWYLLILFSIFVILITTTIILILMVLILKGGSRKIMKTT